MPGVDLRPRRYGDSALYLAEWVSICGVRLLPLIDALRDLLLNDPLLHADETTVPMLAPVNKKTRRVYLWAYATTPYAGLKVVVYDFSEGRGGQHVRDFLGDWRGKLICDDYSGYKQSFASGVTEIGFMAQTGASTFTCTWLARARLPGMPSS